MKRILVTTTILLMLSGSIAHSQVGINNQDPQATLDVTATKTDNSTAEGIIAPRLTLAQLSGKDDQYTANQMGTIVYVSDISGATTSKTAGITKIGYYYYDGSLWQAFSSGSTTDWSTLGNTGTTPGTNYLGTADAADLVVKTNDTERMIVSSAGNVGIGTQTPHASAILDVTATNKSIRIPNVSLTDGTDITTVPDPQKGMIVYNTNNEQFAFYDGTQWRQPATQVAGVVAAQLVGVMKSNTANGALGIGSIWYDTKVYDPENAVVLGTSASNPGKYTVTKSGLHQVYVNYSMYTPGTTWYLRILKNGSPVAAIDTTAAGGASACLFAIENFTEGDVITADKGGTGYGWSGGGLSKMTIFRFE